MLGRSYQAAEVQELVSLAAAAGNCCKEGAGADTNVTSC